MSTKTGSSEEHTGFQIFLRFCLCHTRERDRYLEQISIQIDFKLATLQFSQIFCNRQSQSAAFCGTGLITAGKPLCQLLR